MPYKEVNGLKIHYMTLGDRSRPNVVMLHGLLTGSVASWCFGLGRLLSERYHVLMYDQRGHGMSEQPETGYQVVEFCKDLHGMIPEDGPVFLVGHSFGGIVALAYAKELPERVAGVVTIDTFITGIGDSVREIAGQAQSGDARIPEPEQPEASEPDRSGEANPDVVPARWGSPRGRPRSRLLKEELLLSKTTILDDLEEEGDVAEEVVRSVRVPVLATIGSRSPFREQARALAALLPDAEIAELDGGHGLHVDATDELARLAIGFFESKEAADA